MKVLLAGASGAIGMPLIRRLHAAGHDVLALHRSPEGRARLAAAGANPIRVDVLSTPALIRALQGQRADAVICEITALKKTPMSHKDMTATNILRTKGTANPVDAAAAATVAALEQATPGAAYNIADDGPVSLATLMIVMARAIGAPRPRAVPGWLLATAPIARAAVTGGLRVSSTRAKTELGWT